MTPNLPSGTKTPRSWKAKFQAWLSSRLTPLPPISAPSPAPLAPQTPFLAQEQFAETQRPITEQQSVRTRQLMDRICAVNNAYVTRNYGTHTVHQVSNVPVEPLSADDLADAKKLLGVVAVEPTRP